MLKHKKCDGYVGAYYDKHDNFLFYFCNKCDAPKDQKPVDGTFFNKLIVKESDCYRL